MLFTTFESDTRVDPLHGRKLAAALQHATASAAPVVLRRETSVGHGARAVSRTVGLAADQLAFLAAHTGLSAPPVTDARGMNVTPSRRPRQTDLAVSEVMSRSQFVIDPLLGQPVRSRRVSDPATVR